ncbi:hypothetical protein EFK50_19510 [Nocardioides marmoriginsengisoli]|uniref:Uncharacterized protein n=1 Tax=Nocardioides marmoriginsengisoli TaxID=661483 RepID=A0A3N0CAN1_9ACTN|nr:hypothetical protein [Nocardioides marmoriginsengisoli]RNL60510.1 hypothetical protein EFK50_19510 [Nocardioides marmoriginsengisoli]
MTGHTRKRRTRSSPRYVVLGAAAVATAAAVAGIGYLVPDPGDHPVKPAPERPTSSAHWTGAAADLDEFRCSGTRAGWSARGVLTNTDGVDRSYRVSISLARRATGEVVDSGEVTVVVDGRSSRPITVDLGPARSRKGLDCVPNVTSTAS